MRKAGTDWYLIIRNELLEGTCVHGIEMLESDAASGNGLALHKLEPWSRPRTRR